MWGGIDMEAATDISGLSEEALRHLFQRAGHSCQCRLPHCGHPCRCIRQLAWEDRGRTWVPVNLFPSDTSIAEVDFKWFIYCTDCARMWLKAQQP